MMYNIFALIIHLANKIYCNEDGETVKYKVMDQEQVANDKEPTKFSALIVSF